jgi:hypothetical protein
MELRERRSALDLLEQLLRAPSTTISAVLGKLGVRTRGEAAAAAHRLKMGS